MITKEISQQKSYCSFYFTQKNCFECFPIALPTTGRLIYQKIKAIQPHSFPNSYAPPWFHHTNQNPLRYYLPIVTSKIPVRGGHEPVRRRLFQLVKSLSKLPLHNRFCASAETPHKAIAKQNSDNFIFMLSELHDLSEIMYYHSFTTRHKTSNTIRSYI